MKIIVSCSPKFDVNMLCAGGWRDLLEDYRKAVGRSCVWVNVLNYALKSPLQPNVFISIHWRVSSISLYPQQPLLPTLEANQVNGTFTNVNISLNQGCKDTGREFNQNEGHTGLLLRSKHKTENEQFTATVCIQLISVHCCGEFIRQTVCLRQNHEENYVT